MNTETPEIWAARLNEALERAEKLADGLPHELANARPAPKKWSVVECIEHLNQSMSVYARHVEVAAQRGLECGRAGEPPFSRGTLYGRSLLWGLRKGRAKMKVPALPVFKPEKRTEWDLPDVLARFREHTRALVSHLEVLDGVDLGRLRHKTPFPLLRMALSQTFELHSLHNLRHMEQAENTLARVR